MKKDLRTKLQLHRETLRPLAPEETADARGGTPRASCRVCTLTCPP